MEKNYNEVAANWWSKVIEANNNNMPVPGLDLFEEELSSKIKSYISLNAGMIISTYNSRCTLLDDVAFDTGLDAKQIPNGYEMRILFNHFWIYNSFGKLVSTF